MKILIRALSVVVATELLAAAVLCGFRLNSTRMDLPPVGTYTDAITAAELAALPDTFLFDSAEKWHLLGEACLRTGFLHHATACYSHAAAADPDSAELALIHGYCLGRLGLLDDAQLEFQRAGQKDRGIIKATAWYFQGRICLQREQPAEAEKAFLSAGDDHIPGIYQRAKLLVRAGRLDEAAPLLQRLVDEFPGEVRVWQLKSQVGEATGVPDWNAADAGERARSLLLLHQLPPACFVMTEDIGMAREFNHAQQLQAAGDVPQAADRMLQLTRDATNWRNSNPWLLQTVAAVHLQAGDTATARELLDRQIEREDFPTPRAWNLLGEAAFREQHIDQAIEFWQRAVTMYPDDVNHEKLSAIAEHRGDLATARREQAIGRQYAGIAALRSNNPEQALNDLRDAVNIAPELATAWFYVGEAERMFGNLSDAKHAYRQCIRFQPAHGRAHIQLERLTNEPH